MRARQFLNEKIGAAAQDQIIGAPTSKPLPVEQTVSDKLKFIMSRLSSGEVTDPKTVDFIFKILNKPQIQQAVSSLLGNIEANDTDVAQFQKLNNGILSKLLRKMPVEKEQLDDFLSRWANGDPLVNTKLIVPGSKGSINDLIPDPIAFQVFQLLEQVRATYKMPKKGTAGYGEFGLAMLSPNVVMKAPGDIEVNGNPIEVKGNDARLYADERAAIKEARGGEPGLMTNVIANLFSEDPNIATQTQKSVIQAFSARNVPNGKQLVNAVLQAGPEEGLGILQTEWWRAGFESYQDSIQMPIMVIGFGQFLISDEAQDFISWGCLPRTAANFGYMFGRQAGQNRETYPKIFIPGHNK